MIKVNIVTGASCCSGLDFRLPGFVPIEVARYYSSDNTQTGSFGQGWVTNFDIGVSHEQGVWLYRDEFGTRTPLEVCADEADAWLETTKRPALVAGRDGGLSVITREGRRIWLAQRTGSSLDYAPVRIEDSARNGLGFFYARSLLERICDDFGRILFVVRNSDGFITELWLNWPVRNASMRVASYGYNGGDLVQYVSAAAAVWEYHYQDHLLTEQCNPQGGFEYAAYDARRRCVGVWQSDNGRVRLLSFDDRNRTTWVTNGRGATWQYRYDENAFVYETINPAAEVRVDSYDARGLSTVSADSGRALTIFTQSDQGCTVVSHANGATYTIRHGKDGRIRSMTDVLGHEWNWEYDADGNPTAKTSPSGRTQRFRYEKGFLSEGQFPSGAILRRQLERKDGSVTIKDDEGTIACLVFDPLNLLASVSCASGRAATFQYDNAGRLRSASDDSGRTIEVRYNGLDLPVELWDSWYGSLGCTYSPFGKLLSYTDGLGRQVKLEYEAEELLTAIVDPEGKRNTYEFDDLNRVTRQCFVDGRSERYGYDALGNLTRIEDAAGRTVELTYNEVGMVEKKTYPDGSTCEVAYDPFRRLIQAETMGAVLGLKYDQDGQLVEEKQNRNSVAHELRPDCRSSVRRTSSGGETEVVYSRRGVVTALRDRDAGEFRFEVNSEGRLTAITYPNGALLRLTYDSGDRIVEQAVEYNGGQLYQRTYNYDQQGRVIAAGTAGRMQNYVYDSVGQVIKEYGGEKDIRYSYSPAGDLTSGTVPLEYDDRGRLRAWGGAELSYGEDGFASSLSTPDGTCNFEYNGEGQLEKILRDGSSESYNYDVTGRLLRIDRDGQATGFVWDGSTLIEEILPNGTVMRHTYHPQLRFPLGTATAEGIQYYVPDWRGMVAASFDVKGSLRRYEYTVFGVPLGAAPDHPFRLPGQLQFSPELVYNRFRFYLPESARFLTPDPLGTFAGLNLYAYSSNPLYNVDLLGLCDGERFYRAMSDAEVKAIMVDCQMHNLPSPKCHEAFVTTEDEYSKKLMARHPSLYPKLAEFCMERGTWKALENPAISAKSASKWADIFFPAHQLIGAVPGAEAVNVVHLKFEQITGADKALNYGLRRGSIGEFNKRIKSVKVLPSGPECSGPAA